MHLMFGGHFERNGAHEDLGSSSPIPCDDFAVDFTRKCVVAYGNRQSVTKRIHPCGPHIVLGPHVDREGMTVSSCHALEVHQIRPAMKLVLGAEARDMVQMHSVDTYALSTMSIRFKEG